MRGGLPMFSLTELEFSDGYRRSMSVSSTQRSGDSDFPDSWCEMCLPLAMPPQLCVGSPCRDSSMLSGAHLMPWPCLSPQPHCLSFPNQLTQLQPTPVSFLLCRHSGPVLAPGPLHVLPCSHHILPQEPSLTALLRAAAFTSS